MVCVDINECLTNNGGCHTNATCTNTQGSRMCQCNSGYSGNGVQCMDINECNVMRGGCHRNARYVISRYAGPWLRDRMLLLK